MAARQLSPRCTLDAWPLGGGWSSGLPAFSQPPSLAFPVLERSFPSAQTPVAALPVSVLHQTLLCKLCCDTLDFFSFSITKYTFYNLSILLKYAYRATQVHTHLYTHTFFPLRVTRSPVNKAVLRDSLDRPDSVERLLHWASPL